MTFENIRIAILELFTKRKASLEQQPSTGEALQDKQKELSRLDSLLANPAWPPGPAWLEGLPSLLCGPIVRKVLPDEVTVWVALKAPATVTLSIFERLSDGQKGSDIFSKSLHTVPLGKHLHVAAVRAKPDSPTSSNKLLRGNTYYYNVTWDLGSLEALRSELVYGDKDPLPSFIVPPLNLNDLRILHGSCRNVIGTGFDAFINLDHLMGKAWDDDAKNWNATRPHQLFLTGDQIYADEGDDILLNLVGEAGNALLAGFKDGAFNWEEELPVRDDLLLVDPANKKSIPTNGGFKTPGKLYPGLRTLRGGERCLGFKDVLDELQPFDLLTEGCKFTAKSDNHLFGLGEFFATYLFVWSDKVWPAVFLDPKFLQELARLKDEFAKAAKKKTDPKKDCALKSVEAVFGSTFSEELEKKEKEVALLKLIEQFHFSISLDVPIAKGGQTQEQIDTKKAEVKREAIKKIAKGYVNLVESLYKFCLTAQGVAKIRKGLANVATYMMFDDHELTDDWHMTHDWVNEVYASPLGVRVMQNGLSAYAVFQAWGNTPERFEGEQPGKKFLDALATWIDLKMSTDDASDAVLERVIPCKLLPGGAKEIPLQKDRALTGSEKVIRWDYTLSFGKYEAVVTDARTRRAFPRRELAPAEHLSKDAIKLQAADTQGGEFDPEFTLLVSPCNIVTIPDFRKGIIGTALPLKVAILNNFKALRKGQIVQKGALFNYDPDFADSWVVAELPFERMLARLAARMPKKNNARLPARIIVLSGDVHFSATSRLQYWTEKPFNETEGTANLVMAHLVSSGLKNEVNIWQALHHMGFEAVDTVDDEKRLPKTEVMAGYAKKVDDLTPAELAKRKELIEKTRWFPNYRATMIAPSESGTPSLLPYHQTDPAVKIPPPDWLYRIDHMRGKKPPPTDPNDPKLHKFKNIVAGGFDGMVQKLAENQMEHIKYGKNFSAGLEVIGKNSIAEVTFGWEGKGKLADALAADTDKFIIKVEKTFPRAPFQIILEKEIVQVSKTEPLGADLRVVECKRGAANTKKAAHAKDAPALVRKVVSQIHWIVRAKKEDRLPAGIGDLEAEQFTRYDIGMEVEDLEFTKPVLNV